jgi:hypothetical protein
MGTMTGWEYGGMGVEYRGLKPAAWPDSQNLERLDDLSIVKLRDSSGIVYFTRTA